MKREEVLARKPGRELDALVAEKVMNLCVLDHIQGYGDGCVVSDKGMDEWMRHQMFGKMEEPDLLEPYSTDISAAWEVANRIVSLFPEAYVEIGVGQEYNGEVASGARIYNIRNLPIGNNCNNFPEDICKAALLAVLREE